MSQRLLWSIGSRDGRSPDLLDTYKNPELLGDVVWRVGAEGEAQRWPTLHPSEADPEAGYRLHPYTIEFDLADEPFGTYRLCIHYLAIAPRLAHLEIDLNGAMGHAYPHPAPSTSGEITLLPGLHTSIYSEGDMDVLLPARFLRRGSNHLVLTAVDGGEVMRVELIERVRRLDRMANGAGFVYQEIAFSHADDVPADPQAIMQPSVLYRCDASGALREHCTLFLEFPGSESAREMALDLRLDGGSEERLPIAIPDTLFGHQRVEFDVPDGDEAIGYTLRDGDRTVAEGEARRSRKWKVYVTPHSHTDIGYTHRQWEVAERLSRNIDSALDALESGMDDCFRYHLDSLWVLDAWWATRSPERRQALIEQVRSGRIGLPAAYVDLLTQTAALEDLIRNHEPTERFLRPLHMSADFTSVVDVASLSGSLPALLAGAGVRYLAHANNQDRGPFRLNGGLHRVSPYYWEGTLGGRVLVWLAKMYCELRKVCGSPPMIDSAQRGLEMWLQEYERDEYVPDAVMLYGQEADNTDLDFQPEEFVRQWNATYAYPRLVPSAVGDFFQYVEERFGDRFPTVRGDGGAYWEDGALTDIDLTALGRQTQADLPAAETLESLAVIHGPGRAYPLEHFDEAWKQLLLWDEHTWGAFLSVNDPDALLQRDQWAVKEGMARDASAWATRLLHTAAVEHSLQWNTDGREIVVYNPHNWITSGAVQVEIGRDERPVDAETGAPVPLRLVRETTTQAVVELAVHDLPGLSYRRFPLRPLPDGETLLGVHAARMLVTGAEMRPLAIENGRYRLEIDPEQGCIRSWFDRTLERELVDSRHPHGLGRFLYARGGEGTRLVSNQFDLPDGNPEVLDEFRLIEYAVTEDPLAQRVRLVGEVPAGTLEIAWSLPQGADHLDMGYMYHKQERREREAVYIDFPLALGDDARVLSDSQLGWVDWDRDELPGGCKEWLPLQTGILVRGDADVLIASPAIPLFCVGDVVRGRWPREMRLTGGRVLSYVLNNYWHTNYRGSQGGPIAFSYRLTSGRSISADRAFRTGWEARRPLYGHRISFQDFRKARPPYAVPGGGTLARVGPDRVAVRTLKKARWADGFVIHLQETAGVEQEAEIELPGTRITAAWRCDLLERDLESLPVTAGGTVKIEVAAWGIAAARIEVERE